MALKEITDRLREVEFDLITSSSNHNLSRQEKLGNVNVYRITETYNFLLPKILYPLAAFFKALQLCKQFGRYDIIFALQASQGAGAGWLYKLFNPKVKFILNIQEGKNLDGQGFLINLFRKMIIKRADVITAISNYLAQYVRKINPGADIRIIPNGVDLQKFKVSARGACPSVRRGSAFGGLPAEASAQAGQNEKLKIDELKNKLKIKEGERVIITISRLVSKNGVEDLIESFYKLKTENCKLIIIGGGPLKDSLKFKVSARGGSPPDGRAGASGGLPAEASAQAGQNLKLDDRILFLEEISHDQVPEYLAIADIFVRPSLSEGLGTAFLEAMACGVPVIGTAQGGIVDFLKDNKTGLICKAGDPQDIARKIDLLLSNKDLRENIIANARKIVEERYNWDKIAEEYRKILKLDL